MSIIVTMEMPVSAAVFTEDVFLQDSAWSVCSHKKNLIGQQFCFQLVRLWHD